MTEKEKYLINEEEIELLDRYEGLLRQTPPHYEDCSHDGLVMLCRIKDKNNDIFVKRYEAARLVIDGIARTVGIDPDKTGFYLYTPFDDEGNSAVSQKLREYLSRGGDKVQLKRRVDELETENRVLRSLIGK